MYRILIISFLVFGCSSNAEKKAEVDVKEVQPEVEKKTETIVGDWHGLLDLKVMTLRLSFHITEKDGVLISTFDSLDQGSIGNPTSKTTFEDGVLRIKIENIGASYEGKIDGAKLVGTFTQAGQSFPLELGRKAIEAPEAKKRPQDPKKPYPYTTEEVKFENTSAKIKLAGTLSIPQTVKNPPVVILITGSGGQNRDEEILEHRPFLVWSDYLTRRGIAVLRYDDRGIGESQGVHKGATTFDFATDATAAFKYLQTRSDVIDVKKIGLVGHSEGGLIAPIVASKNKDVAFTILLAGTGVDGLEILRTQSRRSLELDKASPEMIQFNESYTKAYQIIKKQKNADKLKKDLTTFLSQIKGIPEARKIQFDGPGIAKQVEALTEPWLVTFIRTNPEDFLSKTKCPTLAINGSKDFQVLPKLNLNAIEKALKKARNKDFKVIELEGLNHLFQTAQTGSFSEYATTEETVAPLALKTVEKWIRERFIAKKK